MNSTPPPKYANYPNLWRVACELARCKNPDKVLAALVAVAPPSLEQEKEALP